MSQTHVRNSTEEAVNLFLDKYFKESNVCHCHICRMDVTAIMLNSLKPKYVVTEKGALFAQLDDFDPQFRIDLMTNLSQAAQIVKASPRH